MTDEKWDRLDELAAAALQPGLGLEAKQRAWMALVQECDPLPATIRSLVAAVRERDELQRILDYVWNVAAIERIRVVGNDGVAIHVHDLFGPDDPLTEGVRAALHHKDGAS